MEKREMLFVISKEDAEGACLVLNTRKAIKHDCTVTSTDNSGFYQPMASENKARHARDIVYRRIDEREANKRRD